MGASWIHPESGMDYGVGSYKAVHERRAFLLERLVDRLRDDSRAEEVRALLTGDPVHPIDYSDALLQTLVHRYADESLDSRVLRGAVYYVNHSDCDLSWPAEQVELIAKAFRHLDGASPEAFFWRTAWRVRGPVYVA